MKIEIPEISIGKSAWKILEMTYKNQHITIPEMAKKMKLSERAVEKNIQHLKELELLDRVGSDKSGHWKISVNE